MESLRTTLETFTLAAHKFSVEHDDNIDDDTGRSQRNRTTGEAAVASSGNIEDDYDEDDDATATSMNAPEALSNMQLCSVMCRYRGRVEVESAAAAPKLWNGITRPADEDTRAT